MTRKDCPDIVLLPDNSFNLKSVLGMLNNVCGQYEYVCRDRYGWHVIARTDKVDGAREYCVDARRRLEQLLARLAKKLNASFA